MIIQPADHLFLHPAIQKTVSLRAGFSPKGHYDPKVNSFKATQRGGSNGQGRPEGISNWPYFQGVLCLWAGTVNLHGVYRTAEITS